MNDFRKINIGKLISKLSEVNIKLWHKEDEARLRDDKIVANSKRKIDKLNQERNDLIEAIDDWIINFSNKGKK